MDAEDASRRSREAGSGYRGLLEAEGAAGRRVLRQMWRGEGRLGRIAKGSAFHARVRDAAAELVRGALREAARSSASADRPARRRAR